MRFSEFKLSEATLQSSTPSSWVTYLTNLIDSTDIAVGKQGERMSGLKVATKDKPKLKALLKQIEADGGKVDRVLAKQMEELPIAFTGPGGTVVIPLKHIHKSAEIKGGANASGSEKKPWNEGEVAETLLGAALYARFTSKTDISEKDVWAALRTFTNNVVPGGFRVSGTKRNRKSPIDMTALNKPLNNQVVDRLVNGRADLEKDFPNGVKALEDKIAACAAYVNDSSKVIKALEEADANPGAPITIKTDGVGDQRGTKADLQIEIGQWKQLLSLKVNDVKQFGQESGSSAAVVSSFFGRFIPDLDLSDLYMRNGEPVPWTPETGEGWPDMDNKKAVKQLKLANLWDAALDQVYKLTGMAYERAAAHLQDMLTTPEGSASVVTNFYKGIIHHVQGNAQFQTLVILNPDSKHAWKELEFGPDLESALGHYKLEVDVTIGGRGVGNHKLRIYGTPQTPEAIVAAQTKIQSKEDAKKAKKKADANQAVPTVGKVMLLQLRSYQQESGAMRNPIEMGPLLKELTEVQKIEDLPDFDTEPDAQQTATAPTAKASAAKAPAKPTVPAAQAPEQPTTANSPAPQLYGTSVNTLQGDEFVPANDPNELDDKVAESNSDLDRIKALSGIKNF